MSIKYTYKDFLTGKIRFTRKPFKKWSNETGILNSRYAIFGMYDKGLLAIPIYLLTKETLQTIGSPEDEDTEPYPDKIPSWELVERRLDEEKEK